MKKGPGQYHVKDALRFGDLVRVRQSAAKAWPSFADFQTAQTLRLYLKPKGGSLPSLDELDAVLWQEILVYDQLPPRTGNVEVMGSILQGGLPALPEKGWLQVELGFERQGTQQRPKKYDQVSADVREGRMRFGYEFYRSYPYPSFEERKDLLARAIRVARLPMAITGPDRWHLEFSLKHTEGGEVWIGHSDGAPLSFQCDMPGARLDDLLERVAALLHEFASPSPLTLEWTISSRPAALDDCRRVYASATTFPGRQPRIMAVARFDKIDGAEQLRTLCSRTDCVVWQLCGFTLPSPRVKAKQVEVKLWVTTNRDGHWLSMETRPADPPLLPEIKKQLKVELRVLAK
jgi:hypothetical protein